MSLSGKVAAIAGAAGGLGKVVTQQLAQNGVRVVLIGRSQERLQALADELEIPAGDYLISTANLAQPAALAKTAQSAAEKFGQVDILLNLVGGWSGGETLLQVPEETIQTMLDQHLWTTFFLSRAFLPWIEKSSAGRVIVVSSPTATQPGAKTAPYAIGKAAQEALMLTLAEELQGSSATANLIQVKAIDTNHRRDSDPSGKYASWTTPEEISHTILYLCQDAARMINGARIPLYG